MNKITARSLADAIKQMNKRDRAALKRATGADHVCLNLVLGKV